jgi:hypothetical protein
VKAAGGRRVRNGRRHSSSERRRAQDKLQEALSVGVECGESAVVERHAAVHERESPRGGRVVLRRRLVRQSAALHCVEASGGRELLAEHCA